MAQGTFIPTPGTRDLGTRELDMTALRQSINNIALILNAKDSGEYPLTEFLCGRSFFPDPALTSTTPKSPVLRQAYRKVINFGALPNAAVKTVAHGISFTAGSTYTFTHIYGTATDSGTPYAIPLPYVRLAANANISIYVDATDVVIETQLDYSNFDKCFVVLEWIVN